jgi:3-hydroxyisobutyrate dehydrogenase-like beta-hydroxyacid dehydrogenase
MKIAFLGIGLMGKPMVEQLILAGHRLFLFNRTKEKALPFAALGAKVFDSAQEAVAEAEAVILMLKDAEAIERVLFLDKEKSDLTGKVVIQMGTILPAESCALEQQVRDHHGEYLECPVLGSRDKAQVADLILMAGSTEQQFERFLPLFKCFGQDVRRVGRVGQAAALKLALNQLIISLTSAFCLSEGMVEKAGVKIEDFMEILRQSALYAPTFDKKLQRILRQDFSDPNFPVKHMMKDVGLILAQARTNGLDVSLLESISSILARAVDQGLGEQDYSAVSRIINP